MLVTKFIGPTSGLEGEDQDLKNLLVLSHETRGLLLKRVLKQALYFEINPEKLRRKRVAIWKIMLNVEDDNKDYYALRDKVNS